MPDENKLQALRESGFNIMPCCMLCKHFTGGSHSIWGSCEATTYDHLKHTEKGKAASVPAVGWCPSFERSKEGLWLSAHEEFFHESEISTTLSRYPFHASGWNIVRLYVIVAENETQARDILKRKMYPSSDAKYEDYTMGRVVHEVIDLKLEPGVLESHWHGDEH